MQTPERRAWIALLLAEMNETAGDQWWAVADLAALDVPGTADVLGQGLRHSRLCRLGNALADFRNVQVGDHVLESMRDGRTHAHLYRSVIAPVVGKPIDQHAEHGSLRLELAELRQHVIAWQADGVRLAERIAVLSARIK